MRFEYFNQRSLLHTGENAGMSDSKAKGVLSYYGLLEYETWNDTYFPTRGMSAQAEYSLYTDNMTEYEGHSPFSALSASYGMAVPLNQRFTLLPAIYGRVLIGRHVANPYVNAIGGTYFGKYLPQQIPFAGINHIEMIDNSVMVLKAGLRYHIGGNHYATAVFNGGATVNGFF